MQCTGKGLEVEIRADPLNHATVGVHVDRDRAPVRVAHLRRQGEVRFIRAADGFDDGERFGLLDRGNDLVIAQQFGVVGRLAGTDVRVGQPDDLLADDCQGAGDADDQYKEPDGQC